MYSNYLHQTKCIYKQNISDPILDHCVYRGFNENNYRLGVLIICSPLKVKLLFVFSPSYLCPDVLTAVMDALEGNLYPHCEVFSQVKQIDVSFSAEFHKRV